MKQLGKYRIASSATALAIALSACGGGGGGVASIPPPPIAPVPTPTPSPSPAPTPSPAHFPSIIAAAATTQIFSTKGASYTSPQVSGSVLAVSNPSLADSAQMNVRYNAASASYEIQLPANVAWQPLVATASYPPPNDHLFLYRAPDTTGVFDHRSNLQYSALLEWFNDTTSGYSAIGIATPAGNIPITGSASYVGSILGASSESHFNHFDALFESDIIGGPINLSFNFAAGTLSGRIDPTLTVEGAVTALPSLSFTNTVFSSGSTVFSGAFSTSLPGQNSFSGLFTGPNAEEVIGNFAFPYTSPVNGTPQQGAGAFAGRKP
jgi:hypothetical protein